jgi:hypothetical protein
MREMQLDVQDPRGLIAASMENLGMGTANTSGTASDEGQGCQ